MGRVAGSGGERLETIRVRLPAGKSSDWLDDLRRSVDHDETGIELRLYRRVGISADIGIHIVTRAGGPGTDGRPSPLGLRLASALREHGLVEHSVWEEEEIDGNDVSR